MNTVVSTLTRNAEITPASGDPRALPIQKTRGIRARQESQPGNLSRAGPKPRVAIVAASVAGIARGRVSATDSGSVGRKATLRTWPSCKRRSEEHTSELQSLRHLV